MKIPTSKLIVEKVERPNSAKPIHRITVCEPGYKDAFDATKNKKDKHFILVSFHENCDLKAGDKIDAVIFINSNESITQSGVEYFPYFVLHDYKKF